MSSSSKHAAGSTGKRKSSSAELGWGNFSSAAEETSSKFIFGANMPSFPPVASAPGYKNKKAPVAKKAEKKKPVSSSKPRKKRASSTQSDGVSSRLAELSKDSLIKVAKAGIEKTPAAARELATKFLSESKSRMSHCVRCDEDYDPRDNNSTSCVIHEHKEEMWIESRGPMGCKVWLCPGCKRDINDDQPCFVGSHTSSYADLEEDDDYY